MLIWPIRSLDTKIELTSGINLFFPCWYNFIKINLKVLLIGMVKTGCGQSCDGTLKLTVSEEWTDGMNWFLACLYRFTKIKSRSKFFLVDIVKNVCDQSGHGSLKLLSLAYWLFACWYKFKKAKSSFSDFWKGLVKDGSGPLVHETLKICCILRMNVWIELIIWMLTIMQ